MIATKKMIFAISTANPAMPPNPNTAAISATIRNVKAQPSVALLLVRSVSWRNYERRGMFREDHTSTRRHVRSPSCRAGDLAREWQACERSETTRGGYRTDDSRDARPR